MLPRFHWGSVISLADGVFFNEECNYLNRSAKDALLPRLLLLLLLLPASRFSTHLRGSSCNKKKNCNCFYLLQYPPRGYGLFSVTGAVWMA